MKPGPGPRLAPSRAPVLVLAALASLLLQGCQSRAPRRALRVEQDASTGLVRILDGPLPVLSYQHGTNSPGELLSRIHPDNRKYAIARSDYLHPLFGPEGESLTRDWSVDHPHHRGIYWAWPEVDCAGVRGDLHALQRIFAHPIGRVQTRSHGNSSEILAENVWVLDHPVGGTNSTPRPPVLHETVMIRAHAVDSATGGRAVDLFVHFRSLGENLSVARRETDKYGGLNVRLAPIRNQALSPHTDPAGTPSRAAWAQISGTFEGATHPATLIILQHSQNPEYPGDWIQYPDLNWLQPTFPAAHHRYPIDPTHPLTLAYRFWIRPGEAVSETEARRLWEDFQSEPPPQRFTKP